MIEFSNQKKRATGLLFSFLIFVLLIIGCKTEKKETQNEKPVTEMVKEVVKEVLDTTERQKEVIHKAYKSGNIPKKFMEIPADSLGILLDIRYATENNFTKQKIYDCPRCFFRKEVGEKILAIHQDLKERYGFGIKLFDCYRPSEYQKKLWEIVPDENYVTHPSKGSVHSRGMAVDLTIVDKNGKELNMGTSFDFFGKEAHSDNQDLPDNVLKNRQLLKKIMEIYGFKGIRTEWWHYSYRSLKGGLEKWTWDCEPQE